MVDDNGSNAKWKGGFSAVRKVAYGGAEDQRVRCGGVRASAVVAQLVSEHREDVYGAHSSVGLGGPAR